VSFGFTSLLLQERRVFISIFSSFVLQYALFSARLCFLAFDSVLLGLSFLRFSVTIFAFIQQGRGTPCVFVFCVFKYLAGDRAIFFRGSLCPPDAKLFRPLRDAPHNDAGVFDSGQ